MDEKETPVTINAPRACLERCATIENRRAFIEVLKTELQRREDALIDLTMREALEAAKEVEVLREALDGFTQDGIIEPGSREEILGAVGALPTEDVAAVARGYVDVLLSGSRQGTNDLLFELGQLPGEEGGLTGAELAEEIFAFRDQLEADQQEEFGPRQSHHPVSFKEARQEHRRMIEEIEQALALHRMKLEGCAQCPGPDSPELCLAK